MNSQPPYEARSYLFVPGNRPERFDKALASGADAVIVDLEDAVAPQDKEGARFAALRWLEHGRRAYVRINGADTNWFANDVAALAGNRSVLGIVLPKATDSYAIRFVSENAHPELSILPTIESAVGMRALDEIATAKRVHRLLFGTVDFQVDTGFLGDGDELSYFRAQMTIASRIAGIGTPVDGVTVELDDAQAVEASASRARRFGFGGKMCIHPRQVAPTHRAFMPSMEEQAWAQRVVDASKAEAGATKVDGQMIDAPVVERARAILRVFT